MNAVMKKFSLEGKTALVTGACYGIGFAMAQGLHGAGAKVAFCATSDASVEKALNDIRQQGGDPDAYWAQRVNAVPLKRAQTVEDIAHVFLYLSSDFADNMTGQAINVTGGRIMH